MPRPIPKSIKNHPLVKSVEYHDNWAMNGFREPYDDYRYSVELVEGYRMNGELRFPSFLSAKHFKESLSAIEKVDW